MARISVPVFCFAYLKICVCWLVGGTAMLAKYLEWYEWLSANKFLHREQILLLILQNKIKMKQTEPAPPPPKKNPHTTARVGISEGFWVPACIRLLFLACQMPVRGSVCECHFKAHNQNKT